MNREPENTEALAPAKKEWNVPAMTSGAVDDLTKGNVTPNSDGVVGS